MIFFHNINLLYKLLFILVSYFLLIFIKYFFNYFDFILYHIKLVHDILLISVTLSEFRNYKQIVFTSFVRMIFAFWRLFNLFFSLIFHFLFWLRFLISSLIYESSLVTFYPFYSFFQIILFYRLSKKCLIWIYNLAHWYVCHNELFIIILVLRGRIKFQL